MDEETAIHCLRDCCLTQILWKGIIPILANVFLFAGDKSGWLMMNLDAGAMFPPYWPRKFGIVLDLIWQWRNFFVFNGALGSDSSASAISTSTASLSPAITSATITVRFGSLDDGTVGASDINNHGSSL
ncbi:hypothetical protein JHK86_042879 [Glycine max]|nr:hypothetical protein JHK86_042879 [Glycine max]